jgi:hypothetical protein
MSENTSQRSSVCLAIPAFTALLASVRDILNYNRDWAYAKEFLVAVENPMWIQKGPLLKRQHTFTSEHNFNWKTFWDLDTDCSCLRLDLQ